MQVTLQRTILPDSTYRLLFLLLAIVYGAGLFVDVIDVDASQYAAMSMDMLQKKAFFVIYDGEKPYLDKPPLLFWLSSFSFYLFGVSNFAYKLPSFLSTILGIYSTYRLGRLWYGRETGRQAALILASCQAYFLFNNDIRTDTLLTNFCVFSLWQLSEYLHSGKKSGWLLGFIGIGLAMMAKGPLGVMLPALGIFTHLALRREWKVMFRPAWLAGIAITLLVLGPMLYSLYIQHGTYGWRFFFWTQSFGRLTGENVWDNNASPLFLLTNFIWAFLPWTGLFIPAYAFYLRRLIRQKFRLTDTQEGIAFGAFTLPFIALSMSHYQLPHYIFVVMPYAALITARWLNGGTHRAFRYMQALIIVLATAFTVGLCWYAFPGSPVIPILTICGTLAALWMVLTEKRVAAAVVFGGTMAAISINLTFNGAIYPRLLVYQSSHAVTDKLRQLRVPDDAFFTYGNVDSHSLDFYHGRLVPPTYNVGELRQRGKPFWLLTDDRGLYELTQQGHKPMQRIVSVFSHFSVSMLPGKFLNPKTRPEVLLRRYILAFEP